MLILQPITNEVKDKKHTAVRQLHKKNIRRTKCNAVINTTAEVESHIFYSEQSQGSNNKQ